MKFITIRNADGALVQIEATRDHMEEAAQVAHEYLKAAMADPSPNYELVSRHAAAIATLAARLASLDK